MRAYVLGLDCAEFMDVCKNALGQRLTAGNYESDLERLLDLAVADTMYCSGFNLDERIRKERMKGPLSSQTAASKPQI